MANDLIVRLARDEQPASAASASERTGIIEREPASVDVPFGRPSLDFLAPGSARRERLEVARIGTKLVPTVDLVTFGARNRSLWALDALSYRFTKGLLDWSGLRAEIVHASEAERDIEPLLERVTTTDLWLLRQALASHHVDQEAERALLLLVARRILAGANFDRAALPAIAVNLLGAGADFLLRGMLRLFTADSYLRHALTVELEHPRFGGTFDHFLARFNQVYRRFGLEPIALAGEGSTPFTRLRAEPEDRVEGGPLVTVVMSCWSPGEEILLAVRSIIDQSYQNWELIVTDDASPEGHAAILDKVATLDSRIRVVRNDVNAGTYVRRNEALDAARGEFVTMQDSDDWSHPRRLEIQVRDLLNHPGRYANIVRNVRMTEDLSLYSERGMQLGPCEPAIMFRRKPVLEKIGYFDGLRKAADREFRERLEVATGTAVAMVGPEVPLVLMLADVSSLSGSDFRGKWVHPARIAYRSSMRRIHALIEDGEQTAWLPARQHARVIDAPSVLSGREDGPTRLDVLVIIDGRPSPLRRHFLAEVTHELHTALEAGLAVGVMHSDSPTGGREQGYFDVAMQRLVDERGLHRVIDGQQVEASLVLIRHAVALQGHPLERRSVSADRVILIADPNGGDERGLTFARADVEAVARGSFGVEPEWVTLAERPGPPVVESALVEGDSLRIAVSHGKPDGLRLGVVSGGRFRELAMARSEASSVRTAMVTVVGRIALDALGGGAFHVVALLGEGQETYELVLDLAPEHVLTMPGNRLLVRLPRQRLQLLGGSPAGGAIEAVELRQRCLDGVVRRLGVDGDDVEVDIFAGQESALVSLVAVRDAWGVLRRREFALVQTDDRTWRATRAVEGLESAPWLLIGVFKTPLGRVQFPLVFDSGLRTESNGEWHLETWGEHGMRVTAQPSPAPQERRRRRSRLAFKGA